MEIRCVNIIMRTTGVMKWDEQDVLEGRDARRIVSGV
jgi:hypothetical protein